jgi:hypothetical protein
MKFSQLRQKARKNIELVLGAAVLMALLVTGRNEPLTDIIPDAANAGMATASPHPYQPFVPETQKIASQDVPAQALPVRPHRHRQNLLPIWSQDGRMITAPAFTLR